MEHVLALLHRDNQHKWNWRCSNVENGAKTDKHFICTCHTDPHATIRLQLILHCKSHFHLFHSYIQIITNNIAVIAITLQSCACSHQFY